MRMSLHCYRRWNNTRKNNLRKKNNIKKKSNKNFWKKLWKNKLMIIWRLGMSMFRTRLNTMTNMDLKKIAQKITRHILMTPRMTNVWRNSARKIMSQKITTKKSVTKTMKKDLKILRMTNVLEKTVSLNTGLLKKKHGQKIQKKMNVLMKLMNI